MHEFHLKQNYSRGGLKILKLKLGMKHTEDLICTKCGLSKQYATEQCLEIFTPSILTNYVSSNELKFNGEQLILSKKLYNGYKKFLKKSPTSFNGEGDLNLFKLIHALNLSVDKEKKRRS